MTGARPGDLVHVDLRGDRFYGMVVDPIRERRGELTIHPISNGRSPFRIVRTRDVRGVWHPTKATGVRRP